MKEIALHILDIAQNSISAKASIIRITVIEMIKEDRLRIEISDDGNGMDEVMVNNIIDPFVTSRTSRKVGLGIPLFKAAAEACDGWLSVESSLGKGTDIKVEFKRSHIDRMPLGNLADTLLSLVIGSPEVQWIFTYQIDGESFVFDSQLIIQQLDGIPISDPFVISYIRNAYEDGISRIQQIAV